MKTREVNEQIKGKRCKCMFAGLMVTGTIEEIKNEEYSISVKVRFDEPHQWGNELYETEWAWGRHNDDFGTLKHLEIIDEGYSSLKITFAQSIREISSGFAQRYCEWGAINLKEWIDSYESTRFTQIDERTAIITSEYNMECALEWLQKNTPVESYNFIIG